MLVPGLAFVLVLVLALGLEPLSSRGCGYRYPVSLPLSPRCCQPSPHRNIDPDDPGNRAINQASGGHQQPQIEPNRKRDLGRHEHLAHRGSRAMSAGHPGFDQHPEGVGHIIKRLDHQPRQRQADRRLAHRDDPHHHPFAQRRPQAQPQRPRRPLQQHRRKDNRDHRRRPIAQRAGGLSNKRFDGTGKPVATG